MTDLILTPQAEILKNIAIGKKSDLVTLLRKPKEDRFRDLEFILVVLPPPRKPLHIEIRESDLKSIDQGTLPDVKRRLLQRELYLDSKGEPTRLLIDSILKTTPPFRGQLRYKQVEVMRFIEKSGERWPEAILERDGLVAFRRAVGLQKRGWFRTTGELTTKGQLFLKTQEQREIEYLRKHFTTQHISLLSLLTVYGKDLDKSTYQKVSRSKTSWEKQGEVIDWFTAKGIIDKDSWKPTQLGVELRLSKSAYLPENELKEIDFKLEEYARLGFHEKDKSRLRLDYLDEVGIQMRLYRLRASGYLDDHWKPTLEFAATSQELRERYTNSQDPPWILERRPPRLDELSPSQKALLSTLGSEIPYLTHKQILHHFDLKDTDIQRLTRGKLMNMRREIIGPKAVDCYALNNRTANPLLRELGIKDPLRGKFQRGSHMKHDFILFESLQVYKKMQAKIGNEVVGVLHERAIYQMKVSPNDNKGITTPDLVVKLKSGDTVAFEYGNYKPHKMIEKVQNFPSSDVVVFSSDAHLLTQYQELFISTESPGPSKNVSWNFIPEVEL